MACGPAARHATGGRCWTASPEDPEAPTTVTNRQGILRDHLADSLVALELTEVRDAAAIADLGAGAGVPRTPAGHRPPGRPREHDREQRPQVRLHRRHPSRPAHCPTRWRFMRARKSGRVAWAPAISSPPARWPHWRSSPSTRHRCWLWADRWWRGGAAAMPRTRTPAARAAAELGLEPGLVLRVEPYPGALHRHLHVMRKVASTPGRFPRRAGMARKRPLGGASDRTRR